MHHFGRKELNHVQSKALNCIIVRCGFNQHTHRAIIFGSTRYGGANFRHLYTVQGADQIHVFLRYWRSPSTQAGQLLRICVAWLQISAGVSFSVFQDVDTPINHTDSLWMISIRNFLRAIRGQLELSPNFVPKPARENDSFIMDLVIESGWFSESEIKAVNGCRLYLQAVFISDLANAQGTFIDAYMNKGEVNHVKSSFTLHRHFVQDRSSDRNWSTWRKASLLWCTTEHGKLRTRLGCWKFPEAGQHRRVWPIHYGNGKLYTRMHDQPKRYQVWTQEEGTTRYTIAGEIVTANEIPPEAIPAEARRRFPVGYSITVTTSQEISQAPNEQHYRCVKEFLWSVDTWESELLADVTWEENEMRVIEALQSPCLLACDGSVNSHEAGSFGWTLYYSHSRRCAKNAGPARGSRITSYRAEGCGILSATQFLARINEFARNQTTTVPVTIVCDNLSMVRNVNKLLPLLESTHTQFSNNDQHPTLATMQPEWDVLHEIWHTVKDWNGLQISHVQGHQDNNAPAETLSLEARMNIEADALAGQYLRRHPAPHYKCHLFANTHAHLHLDDQTIIYKLLLRIRNAESDVDMVKYLKGKYAWDDLTFDMINWRVHGKTIRSQRHRKTHITKLVHDILPTNRIQHRWNPQQSDKCALCKRVEETRDHLMQCENAAEWRAKCLRTMGMKCDALGTHKGLQAIMLRGISALFQGHNQIPTEGYTPDLERLITAQNAVGWSQLFNGRWSTQWSIIQGCYMGDDVTQDRSPLGDRWNVAVLQELWDLWHELWTYRNSAVHGIDETARREAELVILRRSMRNVYAQRNRVEANISHIFDIPMEQRLAKGAVHVQNWLAIHESLVHNSVTRATERGTRGVRSIRYYSPGHIDNPG